MVARAVGMDDHGLPRTPMAFLPCFFFPMDDRGIPMGDNGVAMVDRGIATA